MQKKIVLSGSRPTGTLHLGNYFGALENWVKLQEEYNCYFFIADWHALTTGYEDTSEIKTNIENVVLDFLTSGLDPNKSTIFLQSSMIEHAELHLLFSMITPLSWLLRCPTYKDQLQQMKDKNITTYGFLGYPCLQAADILMYKADYVPVGEDQLPHLEMTREIARRFNFLYGNVLPEPQPMLTKARVLPGIDGRKMSKSYNNTIAISDTPEDMEKKVLKMITDPERIRKNDPGHPEVCTVYAFHRIFNKEELPYIEKQCKNGEIGCVQCKRKLIAKMKDFMENMHDRRQKLLNSKDVVRDVLVEGNRKAKETALKTINDVRTAMKIDFM